MFVSIWSHYCHLSVSLWPYYYIIYPGVYIIPKLIICPIPSYFLSQKKIIFSPDTLIFRPNSLIFCLKIKTIIFYSTNSHSFHDLDFNFKVSPINLIFRPKIIFSIPNPRKLFQIPLNLFIHTVINFIFYLNYFLIFFKNSFSIPKTSIFNPKKFIFCPIPFSNIFNPTSPFFAWGLFSIPNISFPNQNISFSSQKILYSVPIVLCFYSKFQFFVPKLSLAVPKF